MVGERATERPRAAWPATVGAMALFVWAARLRPDIAFGLVALGLLFTVIERIRPVVRRPDAVRRQGATTDATHFVVDEIFAAAGLVAVLVVAGPFARTMVPHIVPAAVRAQPSWLLWVESLVLAEVCGYWGHRLSHTVPFLWRFHRIHHSSPVLDWLAPSRRHPLDQVFARASVALPVLALGFTVPTVVTHFAIKRFQGLLVHANVDLRFGPLEWVIATPHFHHWHHSAEPGTWNKNYAGQAPVVDWIFGTLNRPDHWPTAYGCDGYVPDVGYLAQLRAPWHPVNTARVTSGAHGVDLDAQAAGRAFSRGERVAEHLVVGGPQAPRPVDWTLYGDSLR